MLTALCDDASAAAAQTKNEVKGGLLLNVVVTQRTTIFKLLASKDETLLIRGDSFLVLNLGLHVLDAVTGFNFQRDLLTVTGVNLE